MRKENSSRQLLSILVSLLLVFLFTGCVSKPGVVPQTNEPLQPISSTVATFDDIELPPEMKYDSARSFSVRNSSFKGGIFVYNGRVDVNSLKDFILATMQNNKWGFHGENNMKEDTVLVYAKPHKTCLAIISESLLSTRLTLVISENVNASTKLNPFGEPVN